MWQKELQFVFWFVQLADKKTQNDKETPPFFQSRQASKCLIFVLLTMNYYYFLINF